MARPPLAGAAAVARESSPVAVRSLDTPTRDRQRRRGVVVRVPGRPPIIGGLTVVDGRIAAIDLIADPAKLGGFQETSGGLE